MEWIELTYTFNFVILSYKNNDAYMLIPVYQISSVLVEYF